MFLSWFTESPSPWLAIACHCRPLPGTGVQSATAHGTYVASQRSTQGRRLVPPSDRWNDVQGSVDD